MDVKKPAGPHNRARSESVTTDYLPETLIAHIDLVKATHPHFADETATLLSRRLRAAALVLSLILAAAFVVNCVVGTPALWLPRLILVAATALCFALVFRSRGFSSKQLRAIELVLFGAALVQLCVMLAVRVEELAATGDAPSVVAVHYQFQAATCVLIFIYGIFMPNTWQRATMVMIPTAVVPFLVLCVQRWWSPEAAALLAADRAPSVLPYPLVASLVGVYGAHFINSARRESYKARQFGQYRLMEPLGQGGMSEVSRAEHVLLKRPCAIKLLKARNGPMPAGRAVFLLRQVCEALQEAHALGLIHRDIKPGNIFAAKRGGFYDVAKLLDFGLVKQSTENGDTSSTTSQGKFSGTPLYMAPEQARAYEDVDPSADVYSLGAVAYYVVTGKPPFDGENILELLFAKRHGCVAVPSDVNPSVPRDLDQIILKCLARNPHDRYQDANNLLAAFDACSAADTWGREQAAQWWQAVEHRWRADDIPSHGEGLATLYPSTSVRQVSENAQRIPTESDRWPLVRPTPGNGTNVLL
jgi:hypothetical protein